MIVIDGKFTLDVWHEDTEYLVWDTDGHTYGRGLNLGAAIQDWKRALQERFALLRKDAADLAPVLAKELAES